MNNWVNAALPSKLATSRIHCQEVGGSRKLVRDDYTSEVAASSQNSLPGSTK